MPGYGIAEIHPGPLLSGSDWTQDLIRDDTIVWLYVLTLTSAGWQIAIREPQNPGVCLTVDLEPLLGAKAVDYAEWAIDAIFRANGL